jgi:hypothetical protein
MKHQRKVLEKLFDELVRSFIDSFFCEWDIDVH